MGFLDNLFGENNDEDFKVGDQVKVIYAEIEGVVVNVDSNTCMISYITEDDKEIIETYDKSDLRKCQMKELNFYINSNYNKLMNKIIGIGILSDIFKKYI